jgi:hypothetical protein
LKGTWFILGRVGDNVEELKEYARAKRPILSRYERQQII